MTVKEDFVRFKTMIVDGTKAKFGITSNGRAIRVNEEDTPAEPTNSSTDGIKSEGSPEPTPEASDMDNTDKDLEQKLDAELKTKVEEGLSEPNTPPEKAVADAPAKAAATVPLSQVEQLLAERDQAHKAELATIVGRLDARDQADASVGARKVTELRESMAIKFGLDEETLKVYETEEQLVVFGEQMLASRSNKIEPGLFASDDIMSKQAAKKAEAEAWHRSRYIGSPDDAIIRPAHVGGTN